MLIRYTVTAFVSAFVTFALFFVMQSLIVTQDDLSFDESTSGALDFVRLKRESAIEARRRRLPEKKEHEPPPPPDVHLAKAPRPGVDVVSIALPGIETTLALSGGIDLGAAPVDTEATPILRVPPIYPPRASERGIEGWVRVEFTISPTGSVTDPVVVESHPSSVFDSAALRAIGKWKYRPKVENGESVAQPRMQQIINFSMED